MRHHRLYLSACAMLVALASTHPARAQQDYLALITDLKGSVMVAKSESSGFRNAVWGMQLAPGDRVKTQEASEVSILFPNNNLIVLGANGALTVSSGPASDSPPASRTIDGNMYTAVADLTLRRTSAGGVNAIAGLRSDGSQPVIELLSPRNTRLTTNRPSFRWRAEKKFDVHRVKLYDQNGLVWSREVDGDQLEFPNDEQPLNPDGMYFWEVEGDGLLDTDASTKAGFTLLSEEELEKVEAQESAIAEMVSGDDSGSNYDFVVGAYYVKEGLLESAIATFSRIADQHPDAALPHEILGTLYREIGLKDQAIIHLQKAVALSRQN